MSDKDLKVIISAEDKASPEIKKAIENVSNFNSGLQNLHAGMEVVKTAAEALAKAYEFVSKHLEKAVEEALASEKANNRLTGALVQTGVWTKALNKELNEHVETLEATVGANGETARGMIATGLQMGLNVEKAKELEQASRQLAAANGISVNEAFSTLQMTLAGQSRALGKLIPDVKELGSAQLKMGGAIEIVLDKTKAQYELYQGSLPAAIEKSTVAHDNLYKAIGLIITQNPDVKKVYGGWIDLLNSTTKNIEAFRPTISGWISSIINAGRALGGMTDHLGTFNRLQKESAEAIKKTAEATLTDATAKNTASASVQKYYGEIAYGTTAQRNALKAQVEGQTEDLKDFTEYLDAKKRLAIGKETERQMELEKLAAGAIKGSGGSADIDLSAEIAIDAETKKQAGLEVLRQKGILNRTQYNQAITASEDIQAAAEIEQARAKSTAIATLMGDTEQAFQLKKATKELHFQQELADKLARAELENATDDQIKAIKKNHQDQFDQQALTDRRAFLDKAIAIQGTGDEQLAAMREKSNMDDDKLQDKANKDLASGLLFKKTIQEASNKTMMALGEALIKNEKIKLEALAGMLFQHLGTILMQEGVANMARSAANFNPAGFALGAAEFATGIAIGRLGASAAGANSGGTAQGSLSGAATPSAPSTPAYDRSEHYGMNEADYDKYKADQQAKADADFRNKNPGYFPGGQGDEGNDYIPMSLSGKSFIVSGGERIVQPEANKDLTKFLNNGESKPGNTYNITLNYSGAGGKEDGQNLAQVVIKEIRRMSEMGTPMISSKAVY